MAAASPLALEQINIVVRDMHESLAFYRLLGVSIEEMRGAEWTEWAQGAGGRVLGSTIRHRRRSGRELGGHHEPDRRVQAPAAAASGTMTK